MQQPAIIRLELELGFRYAGLGRTESLGMEARVDALRAAGRLVGVLGLTGAHMLRLGGRSQRPGLSALQAHRWGQDLARLVGLDVVRTGPEPPPGCIMVANHRSYADIVALLSVVPCLFLAKAELARWPVLGQGASRVGTVFVERGRADSRKAARDALQALAEAGVRVVVFPEGTTHAAPQRGPYRPGIFATAAAAGLPVAPVAIEYADPLDAWVDQDTFVRHFSDRFRARKTLVSLEFGALLPEADGEALRAAAEAWTDSSLAQARQRFFHQNGGLHVSSFHHSSDPSPRRDTQRPRPRALDRPTA